MKIETRNDAVDSIDKLLDTINPLIDSLAKSYDTNTDDWALLYRFFERLWACKSLLHCEYTTSFLISFIGNTLIFSNEEERFQLQKNTNSFFRDVLICNIEAFIKACKTWKFSDYRCINFQQEVKETMESILDFYSALLNSWQEFISNMECEDSK